MATTGNIIQAKMSYIVFVFIYLLSSNTPIQIQNKIVFQHIQLTQQTIYQKATISICMLVN